MGAALTGLEEARELVLASVTALESERVGLEDALARVLAEDIRCAAPVPAFDSSAMDGFALRGADVRDASERSPIRLDVVGESRAGHPAEREVGAGEAVAISTGAIVPSGADAVVPVESTAASNGHVDVLVAVAPGNDLRRAGEDIRAGQLVLGAGTLLGAAELGVLASLGRAQVVCPRRPRVAVVTTGDELVEPGVKLTYGSIYDSNSYSVSALVREAGGYVASRTRVGDDAASTGAALASALEQSDVLVICGGVSVGVHDHVKAALAGLGVDERFWRLALKPGKPTWFGTRGRQLVFGLPGNPVSAMVTFTLLVAPSLRALCGAPTVSSRSTAILGVDYVKRPGRTEAVRCRLRAGEAGWIAEPTGAQGSHVLTSMIGAEALALLPADSSGVRAGERVEIELQAGVRGVFA